MFIISGFHKSTEQDDYENGCIGNGSDYFIDYQIKTATLDDIKAKIASFIGCEVSDLDLDTCEEVGRIDCGRTETEDGDEADKAQIDAWKDGNLVLYYAVYTCYVMQCNPVSVA